MNCRKENNTLILETGTRINFDFPVKGIVDNQCTNCIHVQLDVPSEQSATENLFVILKEDGSIRLKEVLSIPHLSSYSIPKDTSSSKRCVMDWAKEDSVLILENSKRVSFDYAVGSVLETAGIIVITLEVPPGQSMTENVFGVSREGEILWQIERIPETATNPINRYMSVWENPPGIVFACNWNCTNAYIDVKTGKVIDTTFTK